MGRIKLRGLPLDVTEKEDLQSNLDLAMVVSFNVQREPRFIRNTY